MSGGRSDCLRFEPLHFRLALAITAAAGLTALLLVGWSLRRSRAASSGSGPPSP